ncbi:MAG: hypothetical protein LUF92_08680 [Clostridiales bacterium]|nr:hypothetical protein [Clostridiales bacterium]
MRITTSKSKNAESFYITKSYLNDQGKSTSKIIRKLGTLSELSASLGTDREGVMVWAKEQAKMETNRYKQENEKKRFLSHFEPTDSWIIMDEKYMKEDIYSFNLFIIN